MAAKRTTAGSLNQRVVFLEPNDSSDGHGGETDGYVERFCVSARLRPRMGSETVIASRLQGIQPYTLTVRSSSDTRQVTPAWRARNTRTGQTYNITTVVNIDERNAFLEMLVVEGEAG